MNVPIKPHVQFCMPTSMPMKLDEMVAGRTSWACPVGIERVAFNISQLLFLVDATKVSVALAVKRARSDGRSIFERVNGMLKK